MCGLVIRSCECSLAEASVGFALFFEATGRCWQPRERLAGAGADVDVYMCFAELFRHFCDIVH